MPEIVHICCKFAAEFDKFRTGSDTFGIGELIGSRAGGGFHRLVFYLDLYNGIKSQLCDRLVVQDQALWQDELIVVVVHILCGNHTGK